MHENLMDMNHQFLHRRTSARSRRAISAAATAQDWIEVDYSFSRPEEAAAGRGRYHRSLARSRQRQRAT